MTESLVGAMSGIMVVIISVLYLVAKLWYWDRYKYWSRRGVFNPKPKLIIGNLENVLKRKSHFFGFWGEIYSQYKHLPYIGVYCFHRPVLVINDINLAKNILCQDFNHFESRGHFSGGDSDPLAGHLFTISGEKWKKLRAKMTPSFSSGKLKSMYPLVDKIAMEFDDYIREESTKGQGINFTELFAKYAINVIGSIGFGVEFNSFKNPNCEFKRKGDEYFDTKSTFRALVRSFAFFAPDLFDRLKINRINPEINKFFYDLVDNTVKLREQNDYYRNDFLQTLIHLKRNQIIDENGRVTHIKDDMKVTMDDVAANTLLFLFAGYETTATTNSFATYEISKNPRVQEKLRKEIVEVLERHGGVCNYDALKEMTYLTMVLDETMRKHPPLRSLFRKCTKEYKVPGSGLVVEKGTMVFVPLQGYQMDPNYHENPEEFIPERFLPERRTKFHPCVWMPFGDGPRKCLGIRQFYMQAKLGLVSLISKYELKLHKNTKLPIRYNNRVLMNAVDGGVWINIKPLSNAVQNSNESSEPNKTK